MRVIKKINNNVALAINREKEEFIILGKGVGFNEIPYELEDKSRIEKIFKAPSDKKNNKLFEILSGIPMEHIVLTEKIIEEGKKILNKDLNQSLILNLTDHINSSIKRFEDDIPIRSPIEWEIRNIYPEETKVGELALKIIKDQTGISLPSSEVILIAFHFINAQIDIGDIHTTKMVTKIIRDIISIVKYSFNLEFDENRTNFNRFATHIRYFVIRQIDADIPQSKHSDILEILKNEHYESYKCIEKIETYLLDNYSWKCSDDEKLYLILHINRLRKTE
ncbi:beta-glucoside operon transcriptional antiterminator [Halolactibacillus halophilus]|uniref:Transcriptional antiterminator n=1 Tax=Halolactibacillus halophilus TaxID=306540 RepID=A0A1I5QU35_9BACI|nr:PRD domain-containing protein [Halolactibacillus halophilus]GEM01915.1 transcriptional antiterminator [Halolactibacillus halophilus]SFP49531.1 beta-glucoside operon transcriptional antiterminator [Halolactibacillus halophilus]